MTTMRNQKRRAIALAFALLFAAGASVPPARAQHLPAVPGAAPGTRAHDANPPPPNILELKPSLALATLIVFLVLLLVLWRFAWGPLSKALHDREHHIESTLEEAERARRDSERLLAEHRAQMAQAAEQARSLMDEARRTAEASA